MLNVNLVSPDHQFILNKITKRIMQFASRPDITITRSDAPIEDCDIQHYINWFQFVGKPKTPRAVDLLMWTHLNIGEEDMAREVIERADFTHTTSQWSLEQLIELGIPRVKLFSILLGTDPGWEPRPIRLGITTRYMANGKRREWLLYEMASRGALAGFEVLVIGTSWNHVLAELTKAGVKTGHYEVDDDYQKAYEAHKKIIPMFDYLLHLGIDTSLGVLDALACGVPVICPATCYALELINPDDHRSRLFTNADDLENILRSIMHEHIARGARPRARTWEHYGAELADLYRRLRYGQGDDSQMAAAR